MSGSKAAKRKNDKKKGQKGKPEPQQDSPAKSGVEEIGEEPELQPMNQSEHDAKHSSNKEKPKVIFIFGLPASGKSTHCTRIAKEQGYTTISTRLEDKTKSVQQLWEDIQKGNAVVLLDDFPRTQDDLQEWDKIVGDKATVLLAIWLELREDQCLDRIKSVDQQSDMDLKKLREYRKGCDDIIKQVKKSFKFLAVRSHDPIDAVHTQLRDSLQSQLKRKPQAIFIFGAPNTGKSAQSQLLAEEFGFCRLQTRSDAKDDLQQLERNIQEQFQQGKSYFVIDGFPSSISSLQQWDKVIGKSVDLRFAVLLECGVKVALTRQNKGEEKKVEEEWSQVEEKLAPVIQQLEKQKLLYKIDASAPFASDVYRLIQPHIYREFARLHIEVSLNTAHLEIPEDLEKWKPPPPPFTFRLPGSATFPELKDLVAKRLKEVKGLEDLSPGHLTLSGVLSDDDAPIYSVFTRKFSFGFFLLRIREKLSYRLIQGAVQRLLEFDIPRTTEELCVQILDE